MIAPLEVTLDHRTRPAWIKVNGPIMRHSQHIGALTWPVVQKSITTSKGGANNKFAQDRRIVSMHKI